MRLLRVYHPIRNRRVSGCACCACNGHRGKINCCLRAFNHGLDLFISTSTYLPPPPLRRKVHGVYPRYFFHYFLPLPPAKNTESNEESLLHSQESHHPFFAKEQSLVRIGLNRMLLQLPRSITWILPLLEISFFHLREQVGGIRIFSIVFNQGSWLFPKVAGRAYFHEW